MYKVKDGFFGALIGAGCGMAIWCGQCVWAEISCSSVDSEITIGAIATGIILGLIIGIIVGSNEDKEAQRATEEARRQAEEDERLVAQQERERQHQEAVRAEEDILKKWREVRLIPVIQAFFTIEFIFDVGVDDDGNIQHAQPFYNQQYANNCRHKLEEIKTEAIQKDHSAQFVSYSKLFQTELNNTISSLNEFIQSIINDYKKLKISFRSLFSNSLCQLAYLTGDMGYMTSANAAYLFSIALLCPITKVNLDNYGSVITPVDTKEKMTQVSMTVKDLEEKIKNSLYQLNDSPDNYYSSIAKYLYREMPRDAETIMWYYAKKKPFDTEKFEEACELYGSFHRSIKTDIYTLVEMIARIYSKQAIGGTTTVETDQEMIEQWVTDFTNYYESNVGGQCLASALAWMELYSMELNVLKELVQLKVQLHENVQERLRFLSEGGTSNIKVYDIEPSASFIFDSSSENWKENDISICFRNFKMKKIIPHYSLVIKSWKKTLPLANGQKISDSQLFNSFQEMVDDFDGEVTCEHVDAKAIDLANLEYPNTTLFRFTTERNRCVSILFHSEKFGRNLNITILTLFTPESNLTLEEMEKYTLAIKNNIYVNSFRESILQTVDEAIKMDTTIYEEKTVTTEGTIFE